MIPMVSRKQLKISHLLFVAALSRDDLETKQSIIIVVGNDDIIVVGDDGQADTCHHVMTHTGAVTSVTPCPVQSAHEHEWYG